MSASMSDALLPMLLPLASPPRLFDVDSASFSWRSTAVKGCDVDGDDDDGNG
jgi:hypothetical protein